MHTEKPEQPPYVLAHLQCGCTVMQRQEENAGLFYLLQHLEKKPIILWCPEHKRQQVQKLITRVRRRDHWPLIEQGKCSSCQGEMTVPPPPSDDDEPTMPNNAHMQYGVYVRCPSCKRWGSYAFADTAEYRYDVVHRRVDCPECHQETLVSYNPYTATVGEQLSFKCMNCKRPFALVLQSHGDRVDVGSQAEDLFALYAEEWKRIERHLVGANEELLGLHRYGVMDYQEYADIANLLVEARERLRKRLKGQSTGEG